MSATDFPPDPPETDKTGETVVVRNDEFLRTLFVGLSGDIAPVVTSFTGNPASGLFAGRRSGAAAAGQGRLHASINTPNSISSARSCMGQCMGQF